MERETKRSDVLKPSHDEEAEVQTARRMRAGLFFRMDRQCDVEAMRAQVGNAMVRNSWIASSRTSGLPTIILAGRPR